MNIEIAQKQEIVVQVAQQCEFEFGTVAWQGYLRDGRGYLMVPLYCENGVIQTKQILYFPVNSELAIKLQGCAGKTPFWDAVNTYDPTTEFMVLIGFRPITGTSEEIWMKCRPSIAPPVVYNAASHRPVEFGLQL